jgi:predicted DNA-binding transcriptional regulator AlpA
VNEITGKVLKFKAFRGRLLNTKEVAAILRVSRRWVQDHMREKTFPVQWFPVGLRDQVVDSADLDEWLSKIKIRAGNAQLPESNEKT